MRQVTMVIAVAFILTLAPVTAHASDEWTSDAVGDGTMGARLDVASARMRNTESFLAVSVHLERATTGDVTVYLKFKGQPGYLRAVSVYRPRKKHHTRLRLLGSPGTPQPDPCPDMTGLWVQSTGDNSKMRIIIPSSCLHGGDYNKVKFKVLTRLRSGANVDYAPGLTAKTWHWSAFASRD